VEKGGGGGEGILLSLLAASLLLLAQPPFQFILLPFLALTPLVAALGRLSRGPGERGPERPLEPLGQSRPTRRTGPGEPREAKRKAFRVENAGERASRTSLWYGLSFGLLYWGVLLSWVPLEVGPEFSWAFPGYLAQVGLLSLLTALMAWCTHLLNRRRGVPLFLAFPLAWVGMEWLKAHFPFGLSFPWLGLGITLTAWPEWLGMAEWVGESGVSFWLALVNGLLGSAFLGGELRANAAPSGTLARRLRLTSLGVLAAGLPAFLGVARSRTLSLEPGPRVAVVGTHVSGSLRRDPVAGSAAALEQVEGLLEGLGPGEADLVILPEALVGIPLDESSAAAFRNRLVKLARSLETPVLFGALGGGTEGQRPANSAFLLGPQGGIQARYDKVRLVPGMEWGGYRKGRDSRTLGMGRMALGLLICYESIFGSLSRSYGKQGGTLLVNLTSDVWFGTWDSWPGRGFLTQHPAHLVMRAVETRMGVARAANGGVSLLLDPLGRPLTAPLSPGPGLALSPVPLGPGPTLFSRTGDLAGPAAVFGLLALLVPWGTLLGVLRDRFGHEGDRAG